MGTTLFFKIKPKTKADEARKKFCEMHKKYEKDSDQLIKDLGLVAREVGGKKLDIAVFFEREGSVAGFAGIEVPKGWIKKDGRHSYFYRPPHNKKEFKPILEKFKQVRWVTGEEMNQMFLGINQHTWTHCGISESKDHKEWFLLVPAELWNKRDTGKNRLGGEMVVNNNLEMNPVDGLEEVLPSDYLKKVGGKNDS